MQYPTSRSSVARAPMRVAMLSAIIAGGLWARVIANWLVWDFLGEPWRLALIFGGGGALASWAALLWVRAVLRPALGARVCGAITSACGLASLAVAAWVADAPFFLLAGSAWLWLDCLFAAAFALLAWLVFVTLASVLAWLAGAASGRERLRALPHRKLAGSMALGVLAAGYFGLAQPPDALAAMLPDPPRNIPWFEQRRALFFDVLAGAQCDVLVVPVDAARHSLDSLGRNLLTQTMAAEIAAQTGLCVTDPQLALQALGENQRRFTWPAVERLANQSGARWLIRGHAEVAADGTNFQFRWASYQRATAGTGPWQGVQALEWDKLPAHTAIGATAPPELALLNQSAQWPEALGLPRKRTAATGAATALSAGAAVAPHAIAARSLPPQLDDLALPTASALDAAERLQLLAAAHVRNGQAAAHLWIRSLVALRQLPQEDEAVRVLAARAWLYLYRRPHAETLLAQLPGRESQAMHALVRGDFVRLGALGKEAAANPASGPARLIGEIETEWLRTDYRKTAGFAGRRDTLIKAHPGYTPLLYRALSSDEWSPQGAAWVAGKALAERGLAGTDGSWRGWLQAWIYEKTGIALYLADFAASAERAYAAHWREHAAAWRTYSSAGPQPRDVAELLFALNRIAPADGLHTRVYRQALPQAALRETLAMDPVLRTPRVLGLAMQAASRRVKESPNALERVRKLAAHRLGRALVAGADEQADDGGNDAESKDAISGDVPMRPWRKVKDWPTDRFAGTRLDPVFALRAATQFQKALAQTQSEFWYLEHASQYLRQAGRGAEAAQLLKDNQDRFRGSTRRLTFDLKMAQESGDLAAEIAAYRAQIAEGAPDWKLYDQTARALLRDRQPHEAEAVLAAWPGFKNPQTNQVVVSNNFGSAALLLHWAGEPALARPFAENAVQMNTGSGTSMQAAALLAHQQRDWKSAQAAEAYRFARYKSPDAASSLAWYAFLSGDQATGWDAVQRAANMEISLWPVSAALAGLRISGADEAKSLAQTNAWKRPAGPPHAEALIKEVMALQVLGMDRVVRADSTAILASYGGKSGDRGIQLFGQAYLAYRRGDFKAMAGPIQDLHSALLNVSINQQKPHAYTLPFVALALEKTGQSEAATRAVADYRARVAGDGLYLISQGVLEGLRGRHDVALDLLWNAFGRLPHDELFTLPIMFIYLEALETVYEHTKDERYRELIVDTATRYRRAWPFAWAWAFEAKYAKQPSVRRDAIAATLALDPLSARLASLPPGEIEEGRQQLAKESPLRGK